MTRRRRPIGGSTPRSPRRRRWRSGGPANGSRQALAARRGRRPRGSTPRPIRRREARLLGEYETARVRAHHARLALLIQREAIGLRHHRIVDQQFPEPPRRAVSRGRRERERGRPERHPARRLRSDLEPEAETMRPRRASRCSWSGCRRIAPLGRDARPVPPRSPRGGRGCARSTISPACRSRARRICASSTRSGSSPCPRDELARLHASSGTKGKPTVVGYTAGDLDVWREVMARVMMAAGARRGDLLHIAFGYGLFTGGLGFHDGAERIGMTVVPVSSGNTARHQLLLAGLSAGRTRRHALVRAASGRDAGRAGERPARARASLRHVRRRAVDGRASARALERAFGCSGVRYLRPLRDHRARRGGRMRGAGRPPHRRRSLPAGDRRSRLRSSAAARA